MLTLAKLALGASLLSPLAAALRPSDIPADTPISQLLATAKTQLAAGNAQEALTYFDVAITRDPQNYFTIFNRGAAYLSLGKSQQARKDFDKVLQLKPGHEGALVQRAKLRARQGEWAEAESDYVAAGRKKEDPILIELNDAHGASIAAALAVENKNWDECVQQSGQAILVAAGDVSLRQLRATCRFERGEIAEGVSDLQHVLHLNPGDTAPHLKISTLQFYGMAETDAGLSQIRKCLQSDPESKACKKVMRSEKAVDKAVKKVRGLMEKKQNVAATKVLTKNGEEPGLLAEVKEEFEALKKEVLIHENTPNALYSQLLDLTCEAYIEVCLPPSDSDGAQANTPHR
jgi:DnaJ family protein C protein 3